MQCLITPGAPYISITVATVEGTTGTSEMEQSASASVHKVKVVAPCNTGSGASSSKLSGGTAGLSGLITQ